ncbi:response regulator transcription factor [Sphingobacterium paludis]|uniref:AraC-like DNA-binding protein n=1 Tax=Sphingobacterium paludis TaxID=1476465 RepID=A0A4R7D0S8_9SPHI|nr:helix-turn-helix domain-containing protein [Sphingobacterium paludis]TDS12376.1 AraC-like DNA-binding protein [Sphingobacterium paludis]
MDLMFVKTDINQLLAEACHDLKALMNERAIACELLLPPMHLSTPIDSALIKQMFIELMRHTVYSASHTVRFKFLTFTSDDTVFRIQFFKDPQTDTMVTNSPPPRGLAEQAFPDLHAIQKRAACSGITFSTAENGIIVSIPIMYASGSEVATSSGDTTGIHDPYTLESSENPALLLVESDREIFAYLNKELKGSYRILCAGNATEALELLANNTVQLVLTAHLTPTLDGIGLCRHIKASRDYGHIPVLFLTPAQAVEPKIQALMSGADACVEKPFAADFLLAQINNILVNRRIIQKHAFHSPKSSDVNVFNEAPTDNFIARLHAIIQEHIADIDLTVDELAKRMNMSRPTFYRRVKQCSALTPNEIIHISKLQKAAELLAERKYTIAQIAAIVGYSVQSNFSRDFHKHFGTPPSIYPSRKIDVA